MRLVDKMVHIGAGTVAQQVKLQLERPASLLSAALSPGYSVLPTHLPADVSGKAAEDGRGVWAPAIPVGES